MVISAPSGNIYVIVKYVFAPLLLISGARVPWREGCAAANLSWITEENQKNFCHSREGGNPDFFIKTVFSIKTEPLLDPPL